MDQAKAISFLMGFRQADKSLTPKESVSLFTAQAFQKVYIELLKPLDSEGAGSSSGSLSALGNSEAQGDLVKKYQASLLAVSMAKAVPLLSDRQLLLMGSKVNQSPDTI